MLNRLLMGSALVRNTSAEAYAKPLYVSCRHAHPSRYIVNGVAPKAAPMPKKVETEKAKRADGNNTVSSFSSSSTNNTNNTNNAYSHQINSERRQKWDSFNAVLSGDPSPSTTDHSSVRKFSFFPLSASQSSFGNGASVDGSSSSSSPFSDFSFSNTTPNTPQLSRWDLERRLTEKEALSINSPSNRDVFPPFYMHADLSEYASAPDPLYALKEAQLASNTPRRPPK